MKDFNYPQNKLVSCNWRRKTLKVAKFSLTNYLQIQKCLTLPLSQINTSALDKTILYPMEKETSLLDRSDKSSEQRKACQEVRLAIKSHFICGGKKRN